MNIAPLNTIAAAQMVPQLQALHVMLTHAHEKARFYFRQMYAGTVLCLVGVGGSIAALEMRGNGWPLVLSLTLDITGVLMSLSARVQTWRWRYRVTRIAKDMEKLMAHMRAQAIR